MCSAINRKYYVPINPQPLNLNTFLHTFFSRIKKNPSKNTYKYPRFSLHKKTQTPDTQLLASSAFLPFPHIQHLERGWSALRDWSLSSEQCKKQTGTLT
ncbi:hypothetical protein CEXT_239811 [Caerostris extrusa]|uniref:Uncharacterized protein n=1 Tax=Caerostris extrusa TaxID=172846 RepID=A0AAV4S3W7_CAEEX|nr:hypothetical protein CEXT_239811 [Caerostris extrusa]